MWCWPREERHVTLVYNLTLVHICIITTYIVSLARPLPFFPQGRGLASETTTYMFTAANVSYSVLFLQSPPPPFLSPSPARKERSWVVDRVVSPADWMTPDDTLREQMKRLQIFG